MNYYKSIAILFATKVTVVFFVFYNFLHVCSYMLKLVQLHEWIDENASTAMMMLIIIWIVTLLGHGTFAKENPQQEELWKQYQVDKTVLAEEQRKIAAQCAHDGP